jgi:RimJ/RimL family protein N-acetyltransferase
MLEGKNVDLKLVEKEDIPQLLEMQNKPEFWGQLLSPLQVSKAAAEKSFDEPDWPKRFFIQKKDGTKIGIIYSWPVSRRYVAELGLGIGYLLLPGERGKGYCTEAVNLLLDYSFLTSPVVRVQAHTDVRNAASQRVLEKAGFKKEGTIRKGYFERGEHTDNFIFSILREEWKAPRILKGTL